MSCTYVFIPSPSGGTNVITDFADGEDNIDLSRIEGISGFEDLTITADGNDAVIDLSGHGAGTIRLRNTNVDDLDATDFLFDLPPAPVEDGGWIEPAGITFRRSTAPPAAARRTRNLCRPVARRRWSSGHSSRQAGSCLPRGR